jgi:transcriptional regulator with XRE-family HTH domain
MKETLGDFVLRIRKEKNLTLAAVSDRSACYGKRISAGYINHIEHDPRRRVTIDRLIALAHGLDVPIDDLLARIVRVTRVFPSDISGQESELIVMFKELSPKRKADIMKLVDLWHSECSQ